MSGSLVPAVLDKLVQLGNDAATDGVEVLDGPERGDDLPRKYLVLGWSGQPDTRGVEVDVRDNGANQQVEVIDVHGALSISSGDDGQKTVRDEAYAVLDALAAAVRTIPPKGVRGVTRARLARHAVEPFTGNGAGCTVMFTIHIEGTR